MQSDYPSLRVSSRAKNILMGLLVSVVVLLLVEALSRIVKTINFDMASMVTLAPAEGFAYSADLGWERKPGYRGMASGGFDREFDEAGYVAVDSMQVSDATRRKIVFIGDSNTFGYGVSTRSSFVEVTEGLLSNASAINLGVIGYTSYQGRVTLDKYVPILKPDVVVVSFNYNDRRYIHEPHRVDSAEEFQRMYLLRSNAGANISEFLDASYFVRALRRGMREAGLVTDRREMHIDALQPRVNEEAYRRNLSQIAEETKRMGIRLVFLLLKDNPLESYHLKEGVKKLEESGLEESGKMAIAHLTVAVDSNNAFSDLARLYLAKAYRAQGDKVKAAEAAVSRSPYRSLQGGRPIRLDTAYNDIMRQVANDYGVELVDAAQVLDEHPYDYIDFCHFNEDGHRRVGELLASRISHILSVHNPQIALSSREKSQAWLTRGVPVFH